MTSSRAQRRGVALPPEAVVEAYGLGPGSWRLIAPEGLNVSFAFINGRGERLHVKQIRSPRSRDALASSLRRSQEFRTHGVPAPVLRATGDGELIAHDGDNVWVVSEWIAGRHLDAAPPATAAAIGRVCTRLHRALNPEALHPRTWSWPDDWQEVSSGWWLLTDTAQSAFLPAELVGHVRWLHQRWQEQEPAPQASTELVGSIFGDLWIGQFLFTDDLAVCGLLDWDDAGTEGALAEELAGLLFRSFVTRDGSLPLAGPAGSLIRAYQAEFPLPHATWATVGHRMIASGYRHLLHHLGAWLRDEPRTRVPVWRERIVWRSRRLRWLIQHYGGLHDRWESATAPLLRPKW